MAKKKNIFCEKCQSTAHWYKRGKRARVLVCDGNCGVIAHNPKPKRGGVLQVKMLQKAVEGGKEFLGFDSPKEGKGGVIVTDSKDRPNYSERVINEVMRQEGLYGKKG